MSPGSQMRALTAKRARPKSSTMAAGSRVVRKKPMERDGGNFGSILLAEGGAQGQRRIRASASCGGSAGSLLPKTKGVERK